MTALLLLGCMFLLFPMYPVLAGLSLLGAFCVARYWTFRGTEWSELIMFYGALAGIVSALL